jgi:CRP/FNR family cyclic AMP-dependent transcriptional regulator
LTVINRSVLERARPATRAELEGIPWLRVLEGADLQRAQTALRIAPAQTGDRICRFGRAPTFWFGVVDGLLKMSNDTPSGGTITYMGVPPGAWFGEGTLIKREPYRYNIEALRRSTVAGLPIEDFHALLDRSIPFNRYLMNQLNERLGHFIAAREIDRQDDPDSRVAGSLAQLFNPVLYPGVGGLLRITQQELGYLVGLSRQRVNQALNTLAAKGLIGIEYGGVRVRDLAALRTFSVR